VSTLELPVCEACGTAQYPVREVCVRCLSDRLRRQPVKTGGVILARTVLHRSMDERFAPRLPLSIGSVKLDAGPVAIAVLDGDLAPGARVQVRAMSGPERRTVLHAGPE
jgi:uncharacterized OB-fold protein